MFYDKIINDAIDGDPTAYRVYHINKYYIFITSATYRIV